MMPRLCIACNGNEQHALRNVRRDMCDVRRMEAPVAREGARRRAYCRRQWPDEGGRMSRRDIGRSQKQNSIDAILREDIKAHGRVLPETKGESHAQTETFL